MEHARPPTFSSDEAFRLAPTRVVAESDRRGFVTLQTAQQARQTAIEILKNRVLELKNNPLPYSDVDERRQISLAADLVIRMLREIPSYLPLPKVMLLTSQVSLYWDFDEIFAEIDVAGNGSISIYGKRRGHDEVMIDTSSVEVARTGAFFPMDLDCILLPS